MVKGRERSHTSTSTGMLLAVRQHEVAELPLFLVPCIKRERERIILLHAVSGRRRILKERTVVVFATTHAALQ
jgi:hypothetical protein